MIAAFGKLALGAMVIMALGVAAMTLDALPGSIASAQQRLQARAELALDGAAWASVRMDGQKAILDGAAPSTSAQEEAAVSLARAEWAGGFLLGGVTVVDSSGTTIEKSPPPTEQSSIIAGLPEEESSPVALEPSLVEVRPVEEARPGETAEPVAEPAPEIPDTAEEAQDPVEAAEAVASKQETAPEAPQEGEPDCLDDLTAIASARRVNFATARAEIDAASRAHLLNIADALDNCPDARLVITGHTDSRGREARNRQLSLYRADAVAAYLRSAGVDSERLETRGLGSGEPLATNATDEGRSQNRRIEFAVIAPPREGTE